MSAKPKKRAAKKAAATTHAPSQPAAATHLASLPQPQRVPQSRVGEVVQDFIDFGGARSVSAVALSAGDWLVTAHA